MQIQNSQRIPLIDIGTVKLIKDGRIDVYPAIDRFEGQEIVFHDGIRRQFDAIILATGCRPGLETFLEGISGISLDYKEREVKRGLYFCGFYVSPTGVLREISIEAKRIASQIANKQ